MMIKNIHINCGVGDCMPYTTVVELLGKQGYKCKIFHQPLHNNGKKNGYGIHPLFKNNPHVVEFECRDNIGHVFPPTIGGNMIEDTCRQYDLPSNVFNRGFLYPKKTKISDKKCVGIHAGGSSFPEKNTFWAREGWVQLANYFESIGWHVVLLPNGFHYDYEPKIKSKHNYYDVADLSDMIDLMSGLDLFIGNDSGPAHIATALEIPSVVLWSIPRMIKMVAENNELLNAIVIYRRYSYIQNTNISIYDEHNVGVLNVIIDSIKERQLL